MKLSARKKCLTLLLLILLAVQSDAQADPSPLKWWQTAVIYQIYPRSFQDSNGDGIGDLNGIRQRLDYLESLGVDAVWLNPIYPSPLIDTGYDITDYEAIDPQYGTMTDFDRLIRDANRHHIRVLMDFVPDHTSDQNTWFRESASSRSNPKADWYIWANGRGAGPPNNWQSFDPTTKSAWQFDPRRGQYYYHMFDRRQPNLNWRNPAVRRAMLDAMRFWLRRGVSGFRLDAVNYLYVDAQLRDNPEPSPAHPDQTGQGTYTFNQPEYHETMREIRRMVEGFDGSRVLIGETDVQDPDQLLSMYGRAHDELQLPMNFNLFWSPFSASSYSHELAFWESQRAGWPLLFFSNHDFPRSDTRLGDGKHNASIDRVLATLMLTARGTPIIYYGEELGMGDGDLETIEAKRERSGKLLQPPFEGRDAMRTPMQWTGGANAGFTSATPWLPVQANASTVNVGAETNDPGSLLNLYRRLIQLRRQNVCLTRGHYVSLTVSPVGSRNPTDILSYIRRARDGSDAVAVVLNLSPASHTVHLASGGIELRLAENAVLLDESVHIDSDGGLEIGPYGILVVRLAPTSR